MVAIWALFFIWLEKLHVIPPLPKNIFTVKTSCVIRENKTLYIVHTGGYRTYVDFTGATRWTQTNTITFKENTFLKFILPIYKLIFAFPFKKTNTKGKHQIENYNPQNVSSTLLTMDDAKIQSSCCCYPRKGSR